MLSAPRAGIFPLHAHARELSSTSLPGEEAILPETREHNSLNSYAGSHRVRKNRAQQTTLNKKTRSAASRFFIIESATSISSCGAYYRHARARYERKRTRNRAVNFALIACARLRNFHPDVRGVPGEQLPKQITTKWRATGPTPAGGRATQEAEKARRRKPEGKTGARARTQIWWRASSQREIPLATLRGAGQHEAADLTGLRSVGSLSLPEATGRAPTLPGHSAQKMPPPTQTSREEAPLCDAFGRR